MENQRELQRVTALKEGIKNIAVHAFQINLLGINAIVLAKQFGEKARAFGVISKELREFSQSLRQQMQGLGTASADLVSLATQQLKLERQLALLQQTALQLKNPTVLGRCIHQSQHTSHALNQHITQAHQSMYTWLEGAYQVCLFGSVIARSAKIEAAYVRDMGTGLTEASDEFADYIDQILPNLEILKKAIRTDA
ncbi:hypothetical protein [Parvibium lacunae]|uniref:Chemotaxis protein n=1 Tax=Parvibium lacunae TaxID=1888893 RepID=A0A368L843_9BURK|nr:hypothetical protein [Parvibium lacunae]RCS59409.1 hypothetical protein DU000_01355 [Parvibium lacunae]